VHAAKELNAKNPTPNQNTIGVASDLATAEAMLGGVDAAGLVEANNLLQLQLTNSDAARKAAEAQLAELAKRAATLESDRIAAEKDVAAKTVELNKATDTIGQKADELKKQNGEYQRATKDYTSQLNAKIAELQENESFKKSLQLYLTLAGIACGIGAACALRFYLPLALPLGLATGGFIVAAYLVRYIDLLVGIVAVAAALGAVGWAVYRHHARVADIADGLSGAVQKVKQAATHNPAARAAYEQLRPQLIHAFGDGTHALAEQIETRLRKRGVIGKDASFKAAPPATVPSTPLPVAAPSVVLAK
jgi:hypothetical protein